MTVLIVFALWLAADVVLVLALGGSVWACRRLRVPPLRRLAEADGAPDRRLVAEFQLLGRSQAGVQWGGRQPG